mmetsp:Transcript_16435/g.45064  ORF Transcript_16435/g.45064 Transcript_16435/m.45064 type:complete len:99 (+) Transcript_16435:1110-1406(+)
MVPCRAQNLQQQHPRQPELPNQCRGGTVRGRAAGRMAARTAGATRRDGDMAAASPFCVPLALAQDLLASLPCPCLFGGACEREFFLEWIGGCTRKASN